MSPHHVNPLQWHQAVGVARQSCARFFRDGGTPADALGAFGVAADERMAERLGQGGRRHRRGAVLAPAKRAA